MNQQPHTVPYLSVLPYLATSDILFLNEWPGLDAATRAAPTATTLFRRSLCVHFVGCEDVSSRAAGPRGATPVPASPAVCLRSESQRSRWDAHTAPTLSVVGGLAQDAPRRAGAAGSCASHREPLAGPSPARRPHQRPRSTGARRSACVSARRPCRGSSRAGTRQGRAWEIWVRYGGDMGEI